MTQLWVTMTKINNIKAKADYLAKCMRYVELCSRWFNVSLRAFPNFEEAKNISKKDHRSNKKDEIQTVSKVHTSTSKSREPVRQEWIGD